MTRSELSQLAQIPICAVHIKRSLPMAYQVLTTTSMRRTSSSLLATLIAIVSASTAVRLGVDAASATFKNQCAFSVSVYDNNSTCSLAAGSMDSLTFGCDRAITQSVMYRHGTDPQATLAEFSLRGGNVYFDLSIMPPGSSAACASYEACKAVTSTSGFNVGLMIYPSKHRSESADARCRRIMCQFEGCPDAYNFPRDDAETFTCPADEHFYVIFCP